MYLHSNLQAQWYRLLADLQQERSTCLPIEIEHYLAMTLIQGSQNIQLFDNTLAEELLCHMHRPLDFDKWRSLGDKCLIINGLFPQWGQRRCQSSHYVADIGKLAYQQASLDYKGGYRYVFEHLTQHYDEITSLLNHIEPNKSFH